MKRKREKSKFLFDIIGYIRKGMSNSNALTSRMNARDARRIVEKIDLFRREKRRDTKRHYGSLSQCRINTPICRG